MKRLLKLTVSAVVLAGALSLCNVPSFAENSGGLTPGEGDEKKIDKALSKAPYSPYSDRKYPTRPLFGDTHLPTGFSTDTGVWGATLPPRDAYRFARGEQMTKSTGQPVRLALVLDFLVVTDRSDKMD